MAGGVNDNEQHLRHSPVSSSMEKLRKDKSDDSVGREDQAWILLLFYVAVVREWLPLLLSFCVYVYYSFVFKCSLYPASFFPFYVCLLHSPSVEQHFLDIQTDLDKFQHEETAFGHR